MGVWGGCWPGAGDAGRPGPPGWRLLPAPGRGGARAVPTRCFESLPALGVGASQGVVSPGPVLPAGAGGPGCWTVVCITGLPGPPVVGSNPPGWVGVPRVLAPPEPEVILPIPPEKKRNRAMRGKAGAGGQGDKAGGAVKQTQAGAARRIGTAHRRHGPPCAVGAVAPRGQAGVCGPQKTRFPQKRKRATETGKTKSNDKNEQD